MNEAVYCYNGRQFRTVRDARWAAFFDACGVRYKYRPKPYPLGNFAFYRPSFLLEEVTVSHSVYGTDGDFCVSAIGSMNDEKAMLIRRFVAFAGAKSDDLGLLPDPVLLVGDFPSKVMIANIIAEIETKAAERHSGWPGFYSFETIDGRRETAFPGLSYRGKLVLFGTDPGYLGDMDRRATERAYRAAREAQLEYRVVQR